MVRSPGEPGCRPLAAVPGLAAHPVYISREIDAARKSSTRNLPWASSRNHGTTAGQSHQNDHWRPPRISSA
ncbi:hypothetical protein GCM10027444_12230 [Actinopolyspora lacussalsi]